MAEPDDKDVLSIMVATDMHLGYCEKDPERGMDSMNTFEEMLQKALENNVDMILLGGDLFHDNKPSRKTLTGCIELLRKYCMGDRPCAMQLLSDPAVNFPSGFSTVNYEDPNYNIGMPVFSIHGNHDDPTGEGQLCSLDLLSATNLINYFGKATSVDDIKISPILLQKGETKMALYGLGSIRDERLHRTFLNKKVTMLRPEDDEWFNLFVIHQNRVKHSATNYIPENFLPEFLDLIIWGHEHMCQITPEPMASQETYISQPGSTIATSLSDGEAAMKHVGIMKIHQKNFQMEKVPLSTVRPFIIRDVVLEDEGLDPERAKEADVRKFLTEQAEEMIAEAKAEYEAAKARDPSYKEMLPLIRLKVESTGFTTFSTQRFGTPFLKRVANPKEILHFYRKRKTHRLEDTKVGGAAASAAQQGAGRHPPGALPAARVEDLVKGLLDSESLEVLSRKKLAKAVQQFVDKDDKEAIKELVEWEINKTTGSLINRKPDDDGDGVAAGAAKAGSDDEDDDDDDDDGDNVLNSADSDGFSSGGGGSASAAKKKKAKKSGGSGGGRGGGGGAAAAAVVRDPFSASKSKSRSSASSSRGGGGGGRAATKRPRQPTSESESGGSDFGDDNASALADDVSDDSDDDIQEIQAPPTKKKKATGKGKGKAQAPATSSRRGKRGGGKL